jgi:hypothetical protein
LGQHNKYLIWRNFVNVNHEVKLVTKCFLYHHHYYRLLYITILERYWSNRSVAYLYKGSFSYFLSAEIRWIKSDCSLSNGDKMMNTVMNRKISDHLVSSSAIDFVVYTWR